MGANPNDPWVNYTSDTSTVQTPIVKSPDYQNVDNTGITHAAYLFDSITYSDWLIGNFGVRFDDFTSKVRGAQTSATAPVVTLKRTDRDWSYQAGLVAKPTKDSSLYVSYATSSTPPNSLLGEGSEGNSLGTDGHALARPAQAREDQVAGRAAPRSTCSTSSFR